MLRDTKRFLKSGLTPAQAILMMFHPGSDDGEETEFEKSAIAQLKSVDQELLIAEVRSLVDSISDDSSRKMLTLYTGLDGERIPTLERVGRTVRNVGNTRARQRIRKSVRILRQLINRDRLVSIGLTHWGE